MNLNLKVGDVCLFRNGIVTKIISDKATRPWPMKTDAGVSVTIEGYCLAASDAEEVDYDIIKVFSKEENPEYYLWKHML